MPSHITWHTRLWSKLCALEGKLKIGGLQVLLARFHSYMTTINGSGASVKADSLGCWTNSKYVSVFCPFDLHTAASGKMQVVFGTGPFSATHSQG